MIAQVEGSGEQRTLATGEQRALARCCYVLDWSLLELGRLGEPTNTVRALEIYRELGDPNQEAMVLNNLGALAYYRGKWDEAMRLYHDPRPAL